MKKILSKLKKVDLRDVWGHEALDFTNWIAQQENLDALSEEIGVDIKWIKTEAIDKEIGETIEWVDAAVASRIKIKKEVSGVFDQVEAEKYFVWLYEKTILFQKIFGKYFKDFKNCSYA